jgi:hypothetical protein
MRCQVAESVLRQRAGKSPPLPCNQRLCITLPRADDTPQMFRNGFILRYRELCSEIAGVYFGDQIHIGLYPVTHVMDDDLPYFCLLPVVFRWVSPLWDEFRQLVVDIKIRSQNSDHIMDAPVELRSLRRLQQKSRPQQVSNENPTSDREGGNAIRRHALRCLIDWLRWRQC